jgi:hypothetical protein
VRERAWGREGDAPAATGAEAKTSSGAPGESGRAGWGWGRMGCEEPMDSDADAERGGDEGLEAADAWAGVDAAEGCADTGPGEGGAGLRARRACWPSSSDCWDAASCWRPPATRERWDSTDTKRSASVAIWEVSEACESASCVTAE